MASPPANLDNAGAVNSTSDANLLAVPLRPPNKLLLSMLLRASSDLILPSMVARISRAVFTLSSCTLARFIWPLVFASTALSNPSIALISFAIASLSDAVFLAMISNKLLALTELSRKDLRVLSLAHDA